MHRHAAQRFGPAQRSRPPRAKTSLRTTTPSGPHARPLERVLPASRPKPSSPRCRGRRTPEGSPAPPQESSPATHPHRTHGRGAMSPRVSDVDCRDGHRRWHIWVRSLSRVPDRTGNYYGKYGFDALTHAKSMLISPPDVAIDHLYSPFTDEKNRAVQGWFEY